MVILLINKWNAVEWSVRMGLPWWLRWQRVHLQRWRPGFDPWVSKIPWRRKWQPSPVFLPGESPLTEEPGGLHSTGSQSQTRLRDYAQHTVWEWLGPWYIEGSAKILPPSWNFLGPKKSHYNLFLQSLQWHSFLVSWTLWIIPRKWLVAIPNLSKMTLVHDFTFCL